MTDARRTTEADEAVEADMAIERGLLWELDNVELTTVGMDIGSSTSHLMIARLRLQRQGIDLSSRFVAVEREILYRSDIVLTPYTDGQRDVIDAAALTDLADAAHVAAGIDPQAIDTGVVILTGLALERRNSRAIAETFAEREGAFVCATAGHRFEAILAAHGSGAVEFSRTTGSDVVNVDIGGGTTKLSRVCNGLITESLAIAVGARLVVLDAAGVVQEADPSVVRFAEHAGIAVAIGQELTTDDRRGLAQAMAAEIVQAIEGPSSELDEGLVLAGAFAADGTTEHTVFSGGVSEYLHGRESRDFGDLGRFIADAVAARQADIPPVHADAGSGIRATVVGASQHSVSLSGNTIHVTRDDLLPLRNLPVVRVPLQDGAITTEDARAAIDRAHALRGLDDGIGAALMISWTGPPSYANLRALADAVVSSGFGRSNATHANGLVVALDYDIAGLLGRILSEELGIDEVIVLDGLDLTELDFIDLGRRQIPANVVPAVIKSLVFG